MMELLIFICGVLIGFFGGWLFKAMEDNDE